jgi:hypothetical protein
MSERSYPMTKAASSQGFRVGSTYANQYMQYSTLIGANTKNTSSSQ